MSDNAGRDDHAPIELLLSYANDPCGMQNVAKRFSGQAVQEDSSHVDATA